MPTDFEFLQLRDRVRELEMKLARAEHILEIAALAAGEATNCLGLPVMFDAGQRRELEEWVRARCADPPENQPSPSS